jgi:hypothetical protein
MKCIYEAFTEVQTQIMQIYTPESQQKFMPIIYTWDVPFEIRHGLRLMVPDFFDFFYVIL